MRWRSTLHKHERRGGPERTREPAVGQQKIERDPDNHARTLTPFRKKAPGVKAGLPA